MSATDTPPRPETDASTGTPGSTGSPGSTGPVPLLFLAADTGGGHRSAALAVCEALACRYPDQFAPVIADPLSGPGAPWRLRRLTGLYGPNIRIAPWLWGAFWRFADTRPGLWLVLRLLFAPADDVVLGLVAAGRPALIASFHAMTIRPALRARDAIAPAVPVVTVITDLITPHRSWRERRADLIVVPTAAVARRLGQDGIGPGQIAELGLPAAAGFAAGPQPDAAARQDLARDLGASGRRFLVVVTGGAEGSGGIARRAAALVRAYPDVEVVALCGRNRLARHRLSRVAARPGGLLVVRGFVTNMADWLRCADLVVSKAGPGMIAEAACCGVPLVLTSHVPGQERGNTGYAVAAGAARHARSVRRLVRLVGELRADRPALAAMRAASATLARPSAAQAVAGLIAAMAPGAVSGAGQGSTAEAPARSPRPARW